MHLASCRSLTSPTDSSDEAYSKRAGRQSHFYSTSAKLPALGPGDAVLDILMLALLTAALVSAVGYVRACDTLTRPIATQSEKPR
jgi:hypothetical protein